MGGNVLATQIDNRIHVIEDVWISALMKLSSWVNYAKVERSSCMIRKELISKKHSAVSNDDTKEITSLMVRRKKIQSDLA
jgi:hypothetical protein